MLSTWSCKLLFYSILIAIFPSFLCLITSDVDIVYLTVFRTSYTASGCSHVGSNSGIERVKITVNSFIFTVWLVQLIVNKETNKNNNNINNMIFLFSASVAVCVRQTNIVWVAFIAFLSLSRVLKLHVIRCHGRLPPKVWKSAKYLEVSLLLWSAVWWPLC
jgi:hypothetical protein